ncbi:unnamed protein product [Effrenium voratum]|nr:unnamed protein product [Effrenium voratum]
MSTSMASQIFHRDLPAGKPLEEVFLEQLHPKLQEVFASTPALKKMWDHEVKDAMEGLKTDDLSKLDPQQLQQLMEAQKDVEQRLADVNKLVEDHGDAVEHLKSLFGSTTELAARLARAALQEEQAARDAWQLKLQQEAHLARAALQEEQVAKDAQQKLQEEARLARAALQEEQAADHAWQLKLQEEARLAQAAVQEQMAVDQLKLQEEVQQQVQQQVHSQLQLLQMHLHSDQAPPGLHPASRQLLGEMCASMHRALRNEVRSNPCSELRRSLCRDLKQEMRDQWRSETMSARRSHSQAMSTGSTTGSSRQRRPSVPSPAANLARQELTRRGAALMEAFAQAALEEATPDFSH